MKKRSVILFSVFLFLMFLGMSGVYAATSAKLNFCDYSGTIRVMKILGYVLLLVKILVPIILMGVVIIDLAKNLIAGKSEELTKCFSTFIKRLIASFIVFLIPTIMNYVFNVFLENDDTNFQACTVCMFDVNDCVIPNSDPNVDN